MSMILTWWKGPIIKREPEDFDEIDHVFLKSVVEIPILIAERPRACTMISTEHTAFRTLKNGRKTNFFKMIWTKDQNIQLYQKGERRKY